MATIPVPPSTAVFLEKGYTQTEAPAQLHADGSPIIPDSGPGGHAPGFVIAHGTIDVTKPIPFDLPAGLDALEVRTILAEAYAARYGGGAFAVPPDPNKPDARFYGAGVLSPEFKLFLVGETIHKGDFGGFFDSRTPFTVDLLGFVDMLYLVAGRLAAGGAPGGIKPITSIALATLDYEQWGAALGTFDAWVAAFSDQVTGEYRSPFEQADGTWTPRPITALPGQQTGAVDMAALAADAKEFSAKVDGKRFPQAPRPGEPNPSNFCVLLLRRSLGGAPHWCLNGRFPGGRLVWLSEDDDQGRIRTGKAALLASEHWPELGFRLDDLGGDTWQLRLSSLSDQAIAIAITNLVTGAVITRQWPAGAPFATHIETLT